MQHLTGHKTTNERATWYDEETKTTRSRRTERSRRIGRDGEYNPRTMHYDRTKTTTREKRGPDGKLEAVKSWTTHPEFDAPERQDDIRVITAKRDELP